MGFPDKLLQILYGLHDLTSYEIRTREGYSLPFSLPVGLREGCPSSPVLFNLVYSAVVQSYLQLRASRGSLGIRLGSLEGTPIHARRGTGAPGARLAKKLGKPIEFMDLQDLLFALTTRIAWAELTSMSKLSPIFLHALKSGQAPSTPRRLNAFNFDLAQAQLNPSSSHRQHALWAHGYKKMVYMTWTQTSGSVRPTMYGSGCIVSFLVSALLLLKWE